ncbi:D-alanine transaminase/branched-chain amino acid aminotransferase [Lacibacter cauensis]|uniref:branched-chain-amino-acid transaminase n=1 Tax=Lacibacter cauensis TaxID=510947 RepID=A0A562SP59_9BACT|nr:aminotransferase class IV [Lacibacter cauensis]TWI83081.1 D-alanine transaminase/branched-chain amino acid aminotransferase [Lacibacter cauensis]
MWTFINGDWVEAAKASVHVSDLAIQRGYGVFDFFRTVNHKPLFIDDHLARLKQSASILRLSLPYTLDALKQIILELINRNQLATSGIRITVTGGYAADTYSISTPNIIITQAPLTMDDVFDEKKSIRLITEEYVRELPTVKSINYLMGVYLQQKVKDAGADDVLYVKDSCISELPRSNVFVVTHNNELLTADTNVLHGITRKHILQLASSFLKVKEQPVHIEDVLQAKEVFVSSTTKRLLQVHSVNGNSIANGKPGNVTQQLYQLFLQLEQNNTLQ